MVPPFHDVDKNGSAMTKHNAKSSIVNLERQQNVRTEQSTNRRLHLLICCYYQRSSMQPGIRTARTIDRRLREQRLKSLKSKKSVAQTAPYLCTSTNMLCCRTHLTFFFFWLLHSRFTSSLDPIMPCRECRINFDRVVAGGDI